MVEMYTIPDYAWVDAVFPVVISTFTFGCLLGLGALMILRPEDDLIFADRELEVDKNQHSFWGTLGWFCGLVSTDFTHRIYHRIVRFPIVLLFDSRARILAQVSGLQFKRSWFHDVYGLATQPRLPPGLLKSSSICRGLLPWRIRSFV